NQTFGERVGAKAVRAVHGHAGGFSGGVESGYVGFSLYIGVDAAHGVVLGWRDGNRFVNRIHVHEIFGEFTDLWKFFIDLFFTQVANVQVDVVSVRSFKAAAGFIL